MANLPKRVALVYDRVNKWGGAERLLLALHGLFPRAVLFTSVYNPNSAPWANVFPKIKTSFLQKIPFLRNNHELIPFLMPMAFESFSFDKYDLVISVTSEAAKGIITKPGTLHICYCLTPTRYLWSGYNEYFISTLSKIITYPLVLYLRFWDNIASQRPDFIISISETVKRRVKEYYKRDSDVIYPPTNFNAVQRSGVIKKSNYYLVVSRLVPYKKVDLVINTFNKLKYPLVIVGKGSEARKLKSKANDNIRFIDYLTEEELSNYYSRSKALIVAQEEDLGLTVIEAQAHGIPVIAFRKGGSTEIVVDGITGVFFEKQSVESILQAIKKLDTLIIEPTNCIKNAQKFSQERFKDELMDRINIKFN